MTPRYASTGDIPELVALAKREHARSPWAHIPFSPAAAAAGFGSFITNYNHTALRTEGGYLCGLVQHAGFTEKRVGIEYAWYSEDGQGLELLKKFEVWSRNMGAFGVVVHNYLDDDRLQRVLDERMGYVTLGKALHKSLELKP